MKTITVGFTPDPDDAFAFYALVHGRIATDGWKVQYMTAPIEALNVLAGQEALDLAAISSVHYPRISGHYAVLRSGASVGRGYGPALAARDGVELDVVRRETVAVPGDTTTGANLLRLLFRGVRTTVLPFDQIREAIASGSVAAGVLIHEELLNYPELRLRRLLCLGTEWQRRTSLPLPVGLNVVHRRLGERLAADVCRCVQASIRYALANRLEASTWARQFGRGPDSNCSDRFIRMFANDDTVCFPADCERGLTELVRRLHRAGLTPALDSVDYVEPTTVATRTRSVESAPELSLRRP